MAKSDALLKALATAVTAGGGIPSTAELAFMLGVPCDPVFRNFLKECMHRSRLRRLAKGFYESVITPPTPETAIYQLITKLGSHVLSDISLESKLSHIGEMSQVMMGRVTVMTKGRSGCFVTPYGVIELTHTKQPVEQIAPHLYYDPEIRMYRAHKALAINDLKHCQRNQHLLDT